MFKIIFDLHLLQIIITRRVSVQNMRTSPADEAAADSADLADYLLASLNFVNHISEKAAAASSPASTSTRIGWISSGLLANLAFKSNKDSQSHSFVGWKYAICWFLGQNRENVE